MWVWLSVLEWKEKRDERESDFPGDSDRQQTNGFGAFSRTQNFLKDPLKFELQNLRLVFFSSCDCDAVLLCQLVPNVLSVFK